MRERYKAIGYCLFFCLVMLFCLDWVGQGGDFDFHFKKAQGSNFCKASHSEWKCTSYPPLFSWLATPFSGSLFTFKAFILLLFGFILPLTLFFISKRSIVVLLYYATSFFYVFVAGLYAQGLMLLFFLLFFIKTKGFRFEVWFLWFGLVLAAPSIHNWALPLFLFAFIYRVFELVKSKWAFLSCSPFWGDTPKALEQPLPWFDAGNSSQSLTLNNFGSFLLKGCPFPFLFFGLKKIWFEQNWFKGLLILGSTGVAVFFNFRSLYLIPLLILPEVVDLKQWWFKPLVCILIVFQFYQFVTLNLWC